MMWSERGSGCRILWSTPFSDSWAVVIFEMGLRGWSVCAVTLRTRLFHFVWNSGILYDMWWASDGLAVHAMGG